MRSRSRRSSAINGQIAIRGLLDDFDEWERQGCSGWNGAEALRYFCKLENDLEFGDLAYHGNSGPTPIYRASQDKWGAVDTALGEAAQELGYGWHDDLNAPDSTGVMPYPINSRDGVRVSTNDSYLEPARARPNLTIQGDTLVDRLIVEQTAAVRDAGRLLPRDKTIRGSRRDRSRGRGAFTWHPDSVRDRSARSGGATGYSPHRRCASWPESSDHSAIWLVLRLKPESRIPHPGFRHTNCCVRYSSGLAGAAERDMFMASINSFGDDESGRARGCITVWVNQVFSKGEVRVESPDPVIDPVIEINMLDDERDLVRLRDGYRRLHRIIEQRPVQEIIEGVEVLTSTGVMRPEALNAELDDWLLRNCHDTQHPVGTCRMGPINDPRSVVDPDCRVLEVPGLRVVDTSIMPEITRANTNLSVIMCAELMANRLRSAHA